MRPVSSEVFKHLRGNIALLPGQKSLSRKSMTLNIANSIIKSAKAAVVAALALVFWVSGAAGAFFVRAQDKGTEVRESVQRVYFRLDNSVLTPSYMGNAATLETIDSLATVCASNGVSGLVITSFSSLEGNFNYNAKLSERRANALRDFIVGQHPLLRNRVSTNVHAESWDDLRAAVLADSRFSASEKDEIVAIIDSGDEPDSREARLKQLPSYGRLYAAYFKSLRYAEIRFAEDFAAAAAAAAGDNAVAGTSAEAGQAAAGTAAAGTSAEAGTAAGATAADNAAAATAAENAAAAGTTSGSTDSDSKISGQVGVLFPADNDSVERDYAANDAALAAIAKLLENHKPEDFESIVITSGASIEGDSDNNARVSRAYAENLAGWIEENYPQYKGRITVNPCGEDWGTFRSAVESDNNLSRVERNSILSIIDSNDTPENKEARLKSISSWDYVKSHIIPLTRNAKVDFSYKAPAAGSASAAATETDATGKTVTRKSDGTAHVLFPLNGTTVEADHASNRSVFEEISRILDGRKPEDFESLVVCSSSSIDGPVSSNDRFSRKRGESLVEWIEENYPEFKGHIALDSRGEDWDAFIEAILADNNLDEDTKNDILEIASSEDSSDNREARLRKLPVWEGYIKDHILPLTRRASMHATRVKVQAPEPEALPDVEVEDENIAVDQTRDSLDTTVAPVDTLAAPVEPEPVPTVKPLFAVSTNVIYDLAITPNFAIEVPVGKKVSLYGEYTFPWWVSRDNSRAWQILKWDLGARYWLFGGRSQNPMDVMIGPFAGIDLGAGYYDIEPHHKGWQGEFQTVGAEIGWAWDLGKNWRLDAFVGAGWMGTHFRAYQGSSDDKHLLYQESGKLTWFGPTKAGVSVKYIFGQKERRAEK